MLKLLYYLVSVYYVFFKGETTRLMHRTIFVSVLHTLISYYFTYKYGVTGACWCVIISYVLFVVTTWNLSNKVYKMPWFYLVKL